MGYLGDSAATDWVKSHLPQFAGSSVSTPPIVFVTPEGTILKEITNYASTETFLQGMKDVLAENPEFNELSKEEAELQDPLAKAKLQIGLQNLGEAKKLLLEQSSSNAHYLLGTLARLERDWVLMENSFAKVDDQELQDDVEMESAYRHWFDEEYDDLEAALKEIDRASNRYTEARYFVGLAKHFQGDKKGALKVWESLIKSSQEDRWIYRSDWAYSEVKSANSEQRVFTTQGSGNTPLGRIGYMGRKNPDLEGRTPWVNRRSKGKG